MKTHRTIVICFPLFLLAFCSAAFGQNRERRIISAKAGAVNTVAGRVMVTRQGQEPQLLSSSDDLASKDVVTTGNTSNAEILLNPGSYLRLADNSEFQFEDISLDHLNLRLTKGSAIVEATGVADMDLGIKIATPNATFTIIRSGIYRVNVEQGASELSVYKGRASYGSNATEVLKGGNSVRLSNGVEELGKVPKEKDAFELWSKQRAQLLAKANERLSQRMLNGYLTTHGWDSWLWGPRSFGLWTFSSLSGCYTFLPFYYGWSSPYGHYYGSYYWRGGYYGNNPNPIIVNNQGPSPVITGGTGPGAAPGGVISPGPSPSISPGRGDTGDGRAIQKSRDPIN
jgi:hypothetical protein